MPCYFPRSISRTLSNCIQKHCLHCLHLLLTPPGNQKWVEAIQTICIHTFVTVNFQLTDVKELLSSPGLKHKHVLMPVVIVPALLWKYYHSDVHSGLSVCNQIPACEQDWHLQLNFESLDCICGENVANKCWHFHLQSPLFSFQSLPQMGWLSMHAVSQQHTCSYSQFDRFTPTVFFHWTGSWASVWQQFSFSPSRLFSNWFIMSSTIP